MKTTLFLLLILSGTLYSNAQTPSFEWAKSMGGNSFDNSYDITQDNSGNVITVGDFQATVDFDPGAGVFNLTTGGTFISTAFIQKLDGNGNFLWAQKIGNNGCRARAVAVDQSGNIYITGMFIGVEDFDPGAGIFQMSASGDDIFVLKLDNLGNFIWAVQMSGDILDEGAKGIALDGNGNIFITGDFEGTVDFDPGIGTFNLTSAGDNDVFIEKLDTNGNFVWAKSFGGSGNDLGSKIAYDGAMGIYTTGYFSNTVDFDPGVGTTNFMSNGNTDIFTQKLDTNGNFQWATTMGSTGFENGLGITTDPSGNVITTGFFRETVDFDPGIGTTNITSNGSADFFVQKLDANGNLLWAKGIGGSSADIAEDVKTDASGNIYTTGYFNSTIDFDPGAGVSSISPFGNSDVFVLKLQENGDFLWVSRLGGTDSDNGRALSIAMNGAVYTTGVYRGTADLDHTAGTFNLSAVDDNDIFVHKMGQCASSNGTDVQSACNSYTWIDGNTYTSSNNTATWTLTNTAGCDSVVTLDLTVGDFEAPLADVTTLSDIISECEVSALTPPTATDNCVGSITATHNASLPITTPGTTTITWTYNDGNGNISTQNQNVIINSDFTAPVSDVISLADITTTCGQPVSSLTAPTATDNCAGSIIGTHNASLPITTPGTTTITWTYDDGNGNTSTQNQNVIINSDITPPVADNVSLSDLNDPCSVSAPAAPTATDDCAGTITGSPDVTFPITAQGTTVVTWTYDDGNGNTSTQTQNVIVADITVPVADNASLNPIIAECEIMSITAPTATDNCAGSITGTPNVSFPITTQGTFTITWTYDDGNGNTSTQTQDVTLNDVTNPVVNNVILPDVTAECEVTSLNAPTATDNCAGLITGTHNASLPITSQGTTTITWTYDDGNGNTSTQTQDVVITDLTAPSADLANLSDITSECEVTPTAPTATDNCEGAITGTPDVSFPITASGTTTITWTYNDGNGNTSTQTQDVIITPIDVSTTINLLMDNTQEISANAGGYSYQWLEDCGNTNVPISGATAQDYIPMTNGSFAVVISNGSCSDTSDCVIIDDLSAKLVGSSDFNLYPNPTTGFITIESNNAIESIHIQDATGRLVKELNEINSHNIDLELSGENGIYILVVKSLDAESVKRVVKK